MDVDPASRGYLAGKVSWQPPFNGRATMIKRIAAALLAFPLLANACGPGAVATANCIMHPDSPLNQRQPAPYREKWESSWGAIYGDFDKRKTGFSSNEASERNAKKAALAHCEGEGGDNCKLIFAYRDSCVVEISAPHSSWTQLFHDNYFILAKNKGMAACEAAGNTECEVSYEACSLPVRVR